MASSIYDLSVNVSADVASLYTGLNAAADRVSKFGQDVSRGLDSVNSRIEATVDAFKTLAEVSVAGIGVHAFADMIEGAIEAQSNLQDLAVKVGSTASQISSLIPAAKLSGTSLDEVALASSRFSKSLIDVQTGTGKAAEAFKTLGFNAKDAANFLKNPSQGLLELAQHLNEFADDGTKTAAVIALLGRSGQELLPFLKQLGEQSSLVAKVTDDQAAAAHRLEDQWRELQLRGDVLKNSVAAGLVPAFSLLLKSFSDATGGADGLGAKIKDLSADGTLAEWALEVARAFVVVGETFDALGHGVAALGASIIVLIDDLAILKVAITNPKAVVEALTTGTGELAAAFKQRREDLNVEKVAWDAFWNDQYDATSKSLTAQINALEQAKGKLKAGLTDIRSVLTANPAKPVGDIADIPGASGPATKPSTGFNGAAVGGVDAFTSALQNLQKQAAQASQELDDLFSGTKITQAEKYLTALQSDTKFWNSLNAAQKDAIEIAATIAKWREQDVQKIKDQQAAQVALTAAVQKYAEAQNAAIKAIANASASSQLLAISQQQDDVKRQYDRGLLDFKAFYDKQVSLQKQALSVEVTNQQEAIASQQAYVDTLVAQINALDPAKFDSHEQYLKAVYDLYNKLVPANAALVTSQGKLDDTVKKGTEIGKDYVEQIHQANSAIESSVKSINDQIQQQQLANETIGLTASQTHLLIAAHLDEAASLAQLHGESDKRVRDLLAQADAQRKLAGTLAQGEGIQNALEAIKSLDQEAQSVFEDIFQNGDDAFKKLGDDIKKYLIDLIYQLTVRPIIVQLAAQLTGINPANVAGALGTVGAGNPLSLFTQGSSLFGGPSSILGGAGNFLFGAGSAGAAAAGAGAAAGLDTLSIAVNAGADAVGGLSSVLGAATAVAGPLVPVLGLAIPLLSGLFSKSPSPVQGQFQISQGTTGFEDNAFTSSAFGNIGFNDANTQQFSGQAAQVFNQIVAGALDAFQTRFSKEQSDQFAAILKQMTFDTFSGTFTTEDFLQKYGGQVLQQVVQAAFNVLNPALGSVIANFKGTADEIAKFANSLLAIDDATKSIGNDTFTKNVDAALADATQATADKILTLVTVVQQFGDSITGLGPKIEALDPQQMTAFVDALGGAQTAMQTFAYIQENFTTAAQKASNVQAQLTADFANLGLAVPKDHAAFLALLDSIDVTTDAGSKLYASIAALAPEFIAVAGTADQAAAALNQAAQQGLQYFNSKFLSPQEQLNQRQTVDETALAQATAQTTALGAALSDLGYKIIPTDVDQVKQLVSTVLAKYGADSQEYKQLLAIIPVLGDLIDSVGGFATAMTSASNAASQAANDITTAVNQIHGELNDFSKSLSDLGQLAGEAKDFGTQLVDAVTLYQDQVDTLTKKIADAWSGPYDAFKISQATYVYTPELQQAQKALTSAQNELNLFSSLSAQYGADVAAQLVQLEDRYETEKKLYNGNATALALLKDNFQTQWNAIINGVQNGVDGTLSQLDRLKQGIADYLKGLQVGNLSPLSPREQLNSAQEAYVEELVKAQSGDQGALGDITRFADAYLQQAQSFFSAPSSQYRDIFSAVTQQLGDLAGTTPGGLPTATTASGVAADAIASVIPNNGRIASNTDIAALGELMRQLATDSAQANTDDIQQQTDAITTTQRRTAQTVPLK